MSRLVRWTTIRARRVFQGLRWMIQYTPSGATGRRRLLIVYDSETQPMSVGDILLFQATALTLREDHGVDQVDLAFLYNPEGEKHPEAAFHHIDQENIHPNLSWILQAAKVNPYLGSVLLFADRRKLEQYVSQSLDEAMVWSPLGRYASAEYLYT